MKVGIGVICCVAAAAYHASCIYRDYKKMQMLEKR